MVSNRRLDRVFHALSDSTRRQLLERLRSGDRTVGELASRFPVSRAAISKHLTVLADAGLVKRETRGRRTIVRLDAKPLRFTRDWVERYEHFWDARLRALADYVDREEPQ